MVTQMYSDFCKVLLEGDIDPSCTYTKPEYYEGATPKAAHVPLTLLFSDGSTILKVSYGEEHSFCFGFVSYVKKCPVRVYGRNTFCSIGSLRITAVFPVPCQVDLVPSKKV